MKPFTRLNTNPVVGANEIANKPFSGSVAAVTEVQFGEFDVKEYDKIVGCVRSDKTVTLNIYHGYTQTGVSSGNPTYEYLAKTTTSITGATPAEGSAVKLTPLDLPGPKVKISITGHATDAAVCDLSIYGKRV